MSNSSSVTDHGKTMIFNDSIMYHNQSTTYIHSPTSENYFEDITNDMKELDNIMRTCLPPVLIFLGTAGNILTILTMRRQKFCNYSISFYLNSYAVCSLLMLYLFLGSEWISNISNQEAIENRADWVCRLWQFISRVISYSNIWFVVAMLIDRYVAIWQPKKASSWCTKFRAKFVAVSIFVGLIVVSIHAMWTFELMKNSGCYLFNLDNDIHALIWPWMAASFYSYIPLSLIFIFNIMILTGICLKRHTKSHHIQGQNSLLLLHTTLGLSTLYFFLVLPPTIINVVDQNYPPSWLQDKNLMIQFAKAQYAAHYMAWINTVTLFFICLIFSRTFRIELKDMILSLSCLQNKQRIYELQSGSAGSGAHVEAEACSETTPL